MYVVTEYDEFHLGSAKQSETSESGAAMLSSYRKSLQEPTASLMRCIESNPQLRMRPSLATTEARLGDKCRLDRWTAIEIRTCYGAVAAVMAVDKGLCVLSIEGPDLS